MAGTLIMHPDAQLVGVSVSLSSNANGAMTLSVTHDSDRSVHRNDVLYPNFTRAWVTPSRAPIPTATPPSVLRRGKVSTHRGSFATSVTCLIPSSIPAEVSSAT